MSGASFRRFQRILTESLSCGFEATPAVFSLYSESFAGSKEVGFFAVQRNFDETKVRIKGFFKKQVTIIIISSYEKRRLQK